MSMLYDALGVDSLLHVLSYTNAATLARIASGSRLGAVVAHEAQQRPTLLVLKGTCQEVACRIKERLASRPTVAFLQYSSGSDSDEHVEEDVIDFIRQHLPPTTEVLGGLTESLQCAWFPDLPGASSNASTFQMRRTDGEPEIALLLATLPEAKARAFHLEAQPRDLEPDDSSSEEEDWDAESDEEEGGGLEEQEEVVQSIQVAETEEGRANGQSKPQQSMDKKVPEKKDQLDELLSLDPPPKVIVIYHAMRSASRFVERIQSAFPEAAIIGGVVMGLRIAVRSKGLLTKGRGVGALAISGNAPLFAMTCPFHGSSRAADQHVVCSMRRAQQLATDRDQSILGALLFTCNGRASNMFGRHANDALRFQAQFPHAQLMGFYAGGEIGPEACEAADDIEKSTFLRGNAQHQGFTAVYGFFLVPSKCTPSAAFHRAVLYGEVQQSFKDILGS